MPAFHDATPATQDAGAVQALLAETEEVDGRRVLGVWSEGVFFPIDEVPPGEAAAGHGQFLHAGGHGAQHGERLQNPFRHYWPSFMKTAATAAAPDTA